MQSDLDRLLEEYPLEARWQKPDFQVEEVKIESSSIPLLGLQTRDETGTVITAATAGADPAALDRCYFELIERTAAYAARASRRDVLILSPHGTNLGFRSSDFAFGKHSTADPPPSPRLRHSLSNAVGAHHEFDAAREAASLELIERDRVLRSWYGVAPPPRPEPADSSELDFLHARYELEFRSFPDPTDPFALPVCGTFGFPRNASDPFVCAFAAARTLHGAYDRATREFLQRLGFLWGVALPSEPPHPTPTADFHLDYYLYPPHNAYVREWLECKTTALSAPTLRHEGVLYADLTPSHLAHRIWVLKAISSARIPLTFGPGHPSFIDLPPERIVHPIA